MEGENWSLIKETGSILKNKFNVCFFLKAVSKTIILVEKLGIQSN